MAEGAFLLVFVLLALAAPLALYALVRGEHDRRETMDRRDAERAARRDTSAEAHNRDTRNREGGSDAEHR